MGKKGEEQTYANFSDALQAPAMPIPYWRRPSKTTGVHGIVKGVEWVSKSKQDPDLNSQKKPSGWWRDITPAARPAPGRLQPPALASDFKR